LSNQAPMRNSGRRRADQTAQFGAAPHRIEVESTDPRQAIRARPFYDPIRGTNLLTKTACVRISAWLHGRCGLRALM
jgi:hypothetical protein